MKVRSRIVRPVHMPYIRVFDDLATRLFRDGIAEGRQVTSILCSGFRIVGIAGNIFILH